MTGAGAVQRLRVATVAAEARDVLRVELEDPAGRPLPPFEPGAHLALQLPNGLVRQYSLANDWRERGRYVLGVGRAQDSRGGSDFVHAQLRPGMELPCSLPANNFRLAGDAERYLFIAGGIGITPLLAMLRWCEAMGKPWQLVYAVRNRARLAFYEELAPFGRRVRWHCDDEHGGPLPVGEVLGAAAAGTQVYCCGPAPLMRAVQQGAPHLPPESLHFEWFSAPGPAAEAAAPVGPGTGFRIELRRSGHSFTVPEGRSILEVLEENGHEVPFSCREGVCGTCETAVCEGEPDHRDYIYTEAQRASLRSMLICVSRARSPSLVLDL